MKPPITSDSIGATGKVFCVSVNDREGYTSVHTFSTDELLHKWLYGLVKHHWNNEVMYTTMPKNVYEAVEYFIDHARNFDIHRTIELEIIATEKDATYDSETTYI